MASCRPSFLRRPVASIDMWQVVAFWFQWRLVAYGKLSLYGVLLARVSEFKPIKDEFGSAWEEGFFKFLVTTAVGGS